MDKIFGLAPEQLLIVAFLVILVVAFIMFLLPRIMFLLSRKKRNNESSEYVHDADDDQTTNDDDGNYNNGFYNFKVTIFDSAGNIIKEEEIKCQDYEYDEDNHVFYFLDENEKDHYIYVKGNFIIHVDEL